MSVCTFANAGASRLMMPSPEDALRRTYACVYHCMQPAASRAPDAMTSTSTSTANG